MRIAYFSDNFYPELSGISDSIIETGMELAKRGHHIEYFAPRYSNKDYKMVGEVSEPDLGKNIKINRIFSFHYPTPTLQGRLALPYIIRGFFIKNKFDIIHTQHFFGVGLDAYISSRISSTPFVGTNHTLIESFIPKNPLVHSFLKKFFVRYMIWYYNRCRFVTTPSDFLRDRMIKQGLRPDSKSLSNPIARKFFEKSETKEKLKSDLALSEFTVLYVGRLSPEKNVEILLDSFIPFAKKNSNASLVIVGEGSLRQQLTVKAEKSGVSGQIKFLGILQGTRKHLLYDYFHASDVFVMPSTSETQSMGALQAMAAGLPVLLANSGPLPALLKNNTGLLFDPNSAADLETQISKLYSDKAHRELLGKNGSEFADQYRPERIADAWEKIYNDILIHTTNGKS